MKAAINASETAQKGQMNISIKEESGQDTLGFLTPKLKGLWFCNKLPLFSFCKVFLPPINFLQPPLVNLCSDLVSFSARLWV